ncbi:MAG: intein-containing RctB family protein [Candidatus Caldatribacteriota bacterium]
MKQSWDGPLNKLDDYRWEIPKNYLAGMRVPGLIYASPKLLKQIREDQAPEQVANVAFLPGIVGHSLAMPDIHWGYGFAIGGVAATNLDNGVISPGGVGFDINCLSPDTLILHPFGYTLKIREFEELWAKEEINCFDFKKESLTNTKIINFLKKIPDNEVYKITTKTGKTIIATEDHPFYTKDGMISLGNLEAGDEVAIYPFEGVPYKEPSNEIILNEEKVKELLLKLGKGNNGNGLNQIISHLKKRSLLPLRYNSPKLPYILKIMGYVFGDGNIHFVKEKGKGVTSFYGKPEDLEEIRRDISSIGYNCSRVYHRKRDHKVDTLYGKCEFSNIETFCKVVSSSFAILLVGLGTPLGMKTNQDYYLPQWIIKALLWQKRLFLAAFFGAEMSTPKTMLNHNYTFYCPMISMNKQEGFIGSGRKFLEEISDLLAEFGVKTQKISQRIEYVNKGGDISHRLRLILSGQNKDLINLYSKIGFEYNKKRSFMANNTVHYLKDKQLIIEKRNQIAIQAKELKTKEGIGAKAIYKQIDSSCANLRFIQRSIYEGRKTSSRINFNSLSFKDFIKIKTEGLGHSGMLWDEIIDKKKVDFNDYVYDFTVKHSNHNFIANNFVVSNCGIRLIRTNLTQKEVKPKIELLVNELFRAIPSGVGSKGKIRVSYNELRKVLKKGSRWAIENGYGWEEDTLFTEEEGCMKSANPDLVSQHALERGKPQLGTLGSGNHFLEIQVVDEIYDKEVARKLGLEKDQITVMIHSGSRGLGHQVCSDYLITMQKAVHKYGIQLPDRQLACAPIDSPEGKNYYAAMCCAANYAWANRQCIMHWTREVFARVFQSTPKQLDLKLIYDVAHNIAKIEEFKQEGRKVKLCVHRKGATRAFPPFHPDIPEEYKEIGQPVLIPGDMGRFSYCLVGTERAMEETFGSTCHGAGRIKSRTSAKKVVGGRDIQRELRDKGIIVKAESRGTLAEEMSEAYKDVSDVVEVMHQSGISKKVVRMKPLGVIKG